MVVIGNFLDDLENDAIYSVLGKQHNLKKEMIDARVVSKTNLKTDSPEKNWVIKVTPKVRTKLIKLDSL